MEEITAIGIDLVNVRRIKEAVQKWGDRFLKRIFSERERDYCRGKKTPYLHLSARFAAKEAVIKAFQFKEVSRNYFREIEVVNRPGGAPEVILRGEIKGLAKERKIGKILLSLSHDSVYAIAQVVFIHRG